MTCLGQSPETVFTESKSANISVALELHSQILFSKKISPFRMLPMNENTNLTAPSSALTCIYSCIYMFIICTYTLDTMAVHI